MKKLIEWPIGGDVFRADVFEKNHALFRKSLNCLDYGWERISNDFYGINPGLGVVRVFKNGQLPHPEYSRKSQEENYVRNDFDSKKVADILRGGATIVIQRFESYSLLALDICKEINKFTNQLVVGNAYITYGGDGTFGQHWDTHCVFAVQLKGRKRWKVYRPSLDLPLDFQKSTSFDRNNLELVLDEILFEGDVLYIPRGWWHEVIPIEGVPSMHIAAGVHSIKIYEYFQWIFVNKLTKNVDFRRSVECPMGDGDLLSATFETMQKEIKSEENYEQYKAERLHLANIKKDIDFGEIFKFMENEDGMRSR